MKKCVFLLLMLVTFILIACHYNQGNKQEENLDQLVILLSKQNNPVDFSKVLGKHKHILATMNKSSVHYMLNKLKNENDRAMRNSYWVVMTLKKSSWDKKATKLLFELYKMKHCSSYELCSLLDWIDESALVEMDNDIIKRLIINLLHNQRLSENDRDTIMDALFVIGKKINKSKPLVDKLALIIIQNKNKKYDDYAVIEARNYLGKPYSSIDVEMLLK